MKKLLVFLVVVIGMISTASPQTTITYCGGSKKVVVHPGDTVKNLSFKEDLDKFARLKDNGNGIIQFTSHGSLFWIDHPKIGEDTNAVTILWGVVVPDPTLLAYKDDRTGGDINEPKDPYYKKSNPSEDSSSWPITIPSGLVILVIVIASAWKKKWWL